MLGGNGEQLAIAPGATSYTFTSRVSGNYAVGVFSQPPWLQCFVNNTVTVAGPTSATGSGVFCDSQLSARGLVVSSGDAGSTALYLVDRAGRFKVATTQPAAPAGIVTSSGNFSYLTGSTSTSLQTLRLNSNLSMSGFTTGSGSGGSIAASRDGSRVYVGTLPSGLQLYSVNLTTASPTLVTSSGAQQTSTPGAVRAVAVDYSDRLVVAALSSGALATYQFTGTPQPLGQVSIVDAGASAQAIAFSPTGRQVWVVNADDTLSTFFLDQVTGGLTTGPVLPTGGQGANALAVHPSGRFAWVAHAQSNELRRFGIDDGGALAFEAQTPMGGSPVGVLADPSGRLLFVLNHQSQELQSYAIAPDGTLSLVQSARTEIGATGFSLMRGAPVDFDSTTAYLTKTSMSAIDTLGVSRDGGLSFRSQVSSFTTPVALGTDSWGRVVYSTSSTGFFSGALRTWTPGSNGALTLAGTADAGGSSIVVEPSARWLFVSNPSFVGRYDFSLALQSVVSEGSIPGHGPIAVEPLGRALFLTRPSTIMNAYALRRDTGQALTQASLGLPATPLTVKADPLGGRVYVLSSATGALWQVNYDAQTNTLTLDPNALSVPSPGRDLVVDPFGRFVYAATTNGSLAAFRKNPDGGTLLPVGVYDGGTPTQLSIDGAGRSLFVVIPSENAIWAWAIDQASGALSPLGSYSTLSTPGVLVMPSQLP